MKQHETTKTVIKTTTTKLHKPDKQIKTTTTTTKQVTLAE